MKKQLLRFLLGLIYMVLLILLFLSQMQSLLHETGRWHALLSVLVIGIPWVIVLRLYTRVTDDAGFLSDQEDGQKSGKESAVQEHGAEVEDEEAGKQRAVPADGETDRQKAASADDRAKDPATIRAMFDAAVQGYDLTEREKEVAWLLYRGYTNRHIGEDLFIAESTVKKHVSHIYEKMEVVSRKEFRLKVNGGCGK